MKLIKPLFLSLGLCAAFATVPVQAQLEKPIQLESNQKAAVLKHKLLLLHGRVMIQIDDFATLTNSKAATAGDIVTLASGSKTVRFQIDTNKMQTSDKWKLVDQGAVRSNNQIYVPLRWALNTDKYHIEWNEQMRKVSLSQMEDVGENGVKAVDESILSAAEKAFVGEVKTQRGVHQKGDLYVLARGESPNSGYGLRIVSQKQSWEQLFIYVEETKPQPGRMYTQMITYPYLVVKSSVPQYTTVSFINVKTGKVLFEEDSSSH